MRVCEMDNEIPLVEEEVIRGHGKREGVVVNGVINWHRWYLTLSREEKDAYRRVLAMSSLEEVHKNKVLLMFYTYDYLSLETREEKLRKAHLRYCNLQEFRGVTGGMDEEFTRLFDLDIEDTEHEMFDLYRQVVKSFFEEKRT